MARKARWEDVSWQNGLWTIKLSSWKYFHDFVRQKMLQFSHFVWRGQSQATWELESNLDRQLKNKPINDRAKLAKQHLDNFQYSVRGRRGNNPQVLSKENDWWALGQHYGLSTPLLDWTQSSFVALFFAFEKHEPYSTKYRAVYALGAIEQKNTEILKNYKGIDRAPICELIMPFSDDNARLVNQSGLFTRVPLGMTIDNWVTSNYKGIHGKGYLVKILIPNKDRFECLRTLNRMNINNLTLFPDITGASRFSNIKLEIKKY